MPILRAALAYFLYASQAVILERYLSRFSPAAVLLLFYMVTLPIAIGRVALTKDVVWPSGQTTLIFLVIAAVGYYGADYNLIAAFAAAMERGVSYLHAISLTGALYPVFASLIAYAWARSLPNRYHLAAYVLVVGVVWLAAKGQAFEMAKAQAAEQPGASTPAEQQKE